MVRGVFFPNKSSLDCLHSIKKAADAGFFYEKSLFCLFSKSHEIVAVHFKITTMPF